MAGGDEPPELRSRRRASVGQSIALVRDERDDPNAAREPRRPQPQGARRGHRAAERARHRPRRHRGRGRDVPDRQIVLAEPTRWRERELHRREHDIVLHSRDLDLRGPARRETATSPSPRLLLSRLATPPTPPATAALDRRQLTRAGCAGPRRCRSSCRPSPGRVLSSSTPRVWLRSTRYRTPPSR